MSDLEKLALITSVRKGKLPEKKKSIVQLSEMPVFASVKKEDSLEDLERRFLKVALAILEDYR
jgi:hypothetical protein